jgi:hypothetical protein
MGSSTGPEELRQDDIRLPPAPSPTTTTQLRIKPPKNETPRLTKASSAEVSKGESEAIVPSDPDQANDQTGVRKNRIDQIKPKNETPRLSKAEPAEEAKGESREIVPSDLSLRDA